MLGLTGAVAFRVYAAPGNPAVVHVRAADGEWFYPLDRDRVVDLRGPLGVTRIAIENGTARVIDSPCPLKTCVHAGAVSRTDSVIACLPNRVLLTVEGRHEKPYDAESH